jgi:hypothetical protein
MNVKYQIFVSSTCEDLKDERNEVIKACLNMGHIPVGMAMFNAADEQIRRQHVGVGDEACGVSHRVAPRAVAESSRRPSRGRSLARTASPRSYPEWVWDGGKATAYRTSQ